MRGHIGPAALAGVSVLVLAVAASCGTQPTPEVTSSPTTPRAVATPTPPAAAINETSPASPDVPTVATLEAHLDSTLDNFNDGALSCDGSGPVGRGSALTCQRTHPHGPEWVPPDATVLVAVLDDTGRYTFTIPDPPHAAPGDYPAGTISCRTLIDPPDSYASQKPIGSAVDQRGLSYSALLYHWMSLGSPSSMDDDANGLPCETVYPAHIVERTTASPLVPRTGPAPGPVTLQEVRAHLEAVINGIHGGETWLGENLTTSDGDTMHLEGFDCSSNDPARAGSTLHCARDNAVPGWDFQSIGIYVSVLDETGRYTLVGQGCCENPDVSHYPVGSTCADLSQPPPGELVGSGVSQGIPYGQLVYRWMTLGRPGEWDSDGDGRPCEDYWPSDEIDAVMNSTLRP